MTNKAANILSLSRRLTPKHRGNVLAFVHLAYAAEKSAGRALGVFTREPPEYSGRNNAQRSKK